MNQAEDSQERGLAGDPVAQATVEAVTYLRTVLLSRGWKPYRPGELVAHNGARATIGCVRGEVTASFNSPGWDSRSVHERGADARCRVTVHAETGVDSLNEMLQTAHSYAALPSSLQVPVHMTPLKVAAMPQDGGVAWGDNTGQLPTRAYEDDAGLDLYVSQETTIPARGFGDLPCEIGVELPNHVWALILGRSSALRRLGLFTMPAVIDPGWRGALWVAVQSMRDETITVEQGARVGQLIILPNLTPTFFPMWVQALGESPRGSNGFGSSGH